MSNDYDYDYNNQRNEQPAEGGPDPQTPENGAYRYSGGNIPGQGEASGYQQSGSQAGPQTGYTDQSGWQTGYNNGQTEQQTGYGSYQAGQRTGYNTYQTNGNPGAGGYNPNPNPMSGYNVTPPEPEKKKSGGKRILTIAVVCALIVGLGGGAALGMALRGSYSDSEETVTEETVEEADSTETEEEVAATGDSTEESGAINSTVIEVTTNSETTEMTPKDVYETYVNAVVAISNESTVNYMGQISETASSGSGFIISEDGYIITNYHVIEDADTVTVALTSGEEYEATIIGADEENDVALIKIEATDLPTVSIGDSDNIEVGEQVCAIGNPLGELTNTLTVGYVSALDREIYEDEDTIINMFQTDCAINSGNSGGPLFDMNGNVIGITTAKYSSSSSSSASIEGIGFCIPINDAMDIVNDLLEYGYVRGRASLGITCQTISSTVTQYYNLPTGVYVYSVESGSAAETAGVEEGDIITSVDGTTVESVTELKLLLKNYSAGDTATLTIYRSSTAETLEISVTLDEKVSTSSTEEDAGSDTDTGVEGEGGTQDQQMTPSMPGGMS